jgi:spoIIIJ-associated protein
MKQYEYSAKNVQDAIQKGLKELNLKQEDVDIKILSEGGLFSKAKVILITEEEEVVEQVVEVVKPVATKKEVVKVETKKEEKKVDIVKAPKEQPVKEIKEVVKKEIVKTEFTNEKTSLTFIKTLAEKLNAKVETVVFEEDENLMVSMNGEHAGVLIGYRGEGLSGIQYLANVIEQQNEEKENRKRIVLDIENYKEKREEALRHLAERMAKKAIATDRSQRLEPMNSYERRIIHEALSESNVNTYSKGEEPRRYLVIEPKKQEVK